MIKKIIGFLCSVIFCTAIAIGMPQTARAEETETFTGASGKSGDLDWNITAEGHLTVNGEGNYKPTVSFTVYGHKASGPEWLKYRKNICTAKINVKNITSTCDMFVGCSSLSILDLSNFDTGKTKSMSYMFCGCSSLSTLNLGNINTSNVTDMRYMFCGCNKLTSLDVSNFNTSNVIDMRWMFRDCNSLSTLNLGNINTSNVTNMSFIFCDCNGLTSLDVSNFNTSNVTDMGWMFYNCTRLTNLNLSNFDTSNVTDMGYMFGSCDGLNTLDVSSFNTSNVTDMRGMFECCSSLITLNLSNFNTSNVVYMGSSNDANGIVANDGMFYGCSNLSTLDLSNFNTSKTKSMSSMFCDCSSLSTLNLSNINTSNVTLMCSMFDGCSELTSLNLSNFDTKNVTNMWYMFKNCSKLTNLNVNNFDTRKVISMKSTFYGCSRLTNLDLSNFNTNNVKDMNSMFYGCSGFTSLDVSNFNTSNVTDMSSMFCHCSKLTSLNLNNFDTRKVTSMTSMFRDCGELTSLDLSNFNTSNVTSMWSIFYGCRGLIALNLSNFDTSNVTDMGYMFKDCSGLTNLNLSNFDTSNVTSMVSMFKGCSGLISLDLSNFDISNITEDKFSLDGLSALENLCFFANTPFEYELPISEGYHWEDENGKACTAVAKNLPRKMTYKKVNNIDGNIASLSPSCEYPYVDLSDMECAISFDENIKKCNKNVCAYLMEYDSGKIVDQISYDENGYKITYFENILTLRFNGKASNGKRYLLANTKYSILLDSNVVELESGKTFSGIKDKDYWTFKTVPIEHSLITNPSHKKIDDKIYNILYKPLTAIWIKSLDDGTEGLCFGMSYATGAWNDGYTGIKSIGLDKNTLMDFKLDTKGGLSYSYLEYLQLAQICQHLSEIQHKLNESKNDYNNLYNAIKEFQNGTGSMIIFCVHNKDKGHAVVPLGILSEDKNSVIIACYNCNGNSGNGYGGFISYLTLIKNNGDFIDWNFEDYNNRNGKKGYFEIYKIDDIFDIIACMSSKSTSYNNKETSNLIFSGIELDNLEEISNVCTNGANNNVRKHLYWTDGTSVSRTANNDTADMSEIGITNGYNEISMNLPMNSDVKMDLSNGTLNAKLQTNTKYIATYKDVVNDATIDTIVINGTADDNVSTKKTGEDIILQSDNLKNITVSTGNSTNVTFSSVKSSVLINIHEGIITVSEDSDDDGIYDNIISGSSNIFVPTSCEHLFYDYDYTTPASGSSITIYGNGIKNKDINQRQFIAYTDITASYKYTVNSKGIVKPAVGKVIVGVTKSDVKPEVNSKNKITDTSASNIAKARIKNGQITVTAVGKESGTVYLWVIDTGNKGVSACCPIDVKLAPKKLEVQSTTGTKLTKTKLANGNTLELCVAGLVGSTKTDDCTYTPTVDSKYQSYIMVTPVDGSTNKFTIKAIGLKNNKDTKVAVTFKCDQNGKKTNFSLTVTK